MGNKMYENHRNGPFCKSMTMDKINHHATSSHVQGVMIARQDHIQNYFRLIARTFDTNPSAEWFTPTSTPHRTTDS